MKTKLRKMLGWALLAAPFAAPFAALLAHEVHERGVTPIVGGFVIGLAVFGLLFAAITLLTKP